MLVEFMILVSLDLVRGRATETQPQALAHGHSRNLDFFLKGAGPWLGAYVDWVRSFRLQKKITKSPRRKNVWKYSEQNISKLFVYIIITVVGPVGGPEKGLRK